MKFKYLFFTLLFSALIFSGCTNTFMGTVFVFTFKDILLYISMAFILAFIISIFSNHSKKTFWIWVILNLLLTPLAGFIYLLIKMSSRAS